jgi:hypothetical protein
MIGDTDLLQDRFLVPLDVLDIFEKEIDFPYKIENNHTVQ